MNRPARRPRRTPDDAGDPQPAGSLPFAPKIEDGAVATTPSGAQRDIFAATERLLQVSPVGDLTVAQILVEAGVSRTTFYKYFTSKHMVVSSMLRAVQAELIDVMKPWSTRGAQSPADALRQAMRAVAQVWGGNRPVLRACSECWHSEPEIGSQWVAMLDRFVIDIARQIDCERRRGAAPAGIDSLGLARQLAWGGERMMYLAGFGICGPGLENDVIEPLVAVWTGAIYRN